MECGDVQPPSRDRSDNYYSSLSRPPGPLGLGADRLGQAKTLSHCVPEEIREKMVNGGEWWIRINQGKDVPQNKIL